MQGIKYCLLHFDTEGVCFSRHLIKYNFVDLRSGIVNQSTQVQHLISNLSPLPLYHIGQEQ